ncbi:acyltransferase [Kitasatospora terrestris]|uniref:Acyltransferase n=1 Tax=Kitasatospora terrestris TaxID=258051 RepID=A0ABP9E8X4_9ACTN
MSNSFGWFGGSQETVPPHAPASLGRHEDTVALRIPEQWRQEAEPEPQEPQAAPKAKGGRDRYLDLLRALALVRVILYHNFSWAWLPIVFPSMGVMFALAGSLMARSLKRPALGVIRGRLRRLLPPMWLFGIIMVGLQVYDGGGPHGPASDGHPTWWWAKLAFWILPLSTPPYPGALPGFHHTVETTWAEQVIVPLWYLRAYLWYVLLSPLMLKALRRFPVATLCAPLVMVIGMNAFGGNEPEFIYSRVWETANDFATFGACWILGMAHQEGMLKRIPQYVLPSIAPLIMVAGLWYLGTRPVDPGEVTDLESWPIAQALWSFGFVAILLHVSPSWDQWPAPLERWNGLVSLLNSRAVSVYLWHEVALTLAVPVLDPLWSYDYLSSNFKWLLNSPWLDLLTAIPLLALLVLVFGWVEDVAAKRPPRLFPYPRRQRGKRRAAE